VLAFPPGEPLAPPLVRLAPLIYLQVRSDI